MLNTPSQGGDEIFLSLFQRRITAVFLVVVVVVGLTTA